MKSEETGRIRLLHRHPPSAREWPGEVREKVGRARLELVSRGESENKIFRVQRPDRCDAYLKVSAGAQLPELQREHAVLSWLDGRFRAPVVEGYFVQPGNAYLLTSARPGRSAWGWALGLQAKPSLEVLSRALWEIHSVPVGACPFDRRLSFVVPQAHRKAEEGLVDLDHFDEKRRGWTVELLLDELDRSVPGSEDLVFTHGDFSLPNVLLQGGRVSGVVDWGRAGIADRYQDIALLLRSFSHLPSHELERRFGRGYGNRDLDFEKVRFYQLLDEFF